LIFFDFPFSHFLQVNLFFFLNRKSALSMQDSVETPDGNSVGDSVVGTPDGNSVGEKVGNSVGDLVGVVVGESLGSDDGVIPTQKTLVKLKR